MLAGIKHDVITAVWPHFDVLIGANWSQEGTARPAAPPGGGQSAALMFSTSGAAAAKSDK